jgi:2-polyprenyl-6-methoxyphenol hydroxylase-like FAD-dependent oxidoreductase
MRTRDHLVVTPARSHDRCRGRAVVIGGSMAGMLAARVLSDHFDSVTLLERDEFPEAPAARKGLPQGRHAHALLERGRGVLERFLPGLTEQLVREGAHLMDTTQDVAWLNPYGWYVRFPGSLSMLGCSRDLIDWSVRQRVGALPNVRILERVDVAGLIRGPGDGGCVTGVWLRARAGDIKADLSGAELAADLVVCADGRNSRLPDWLTALGYEPPRETVVNSHQGYASRLYQPAAGFKAEWKALYIQQAPPADPRGGLIFEVERGRWLVSLVGGDGDYPPTDHVGFLAFARSLRSPEIFDAIAAAEPLTPIAGQRATENRIRHYDRVARFPEGVVAVGDAVCAFNPVYGQGMTAAALGAEVLDRWLQGESSQSGDGRGRAFQRALARATAAAWQISTGADHRFRTTTGPPEVRVARLVGSYISGVIRAATKQPRVRRRLTEVLHLLRPPSALFSPGVLARVAWDRLSKSNRAVVAMVRARPGATGDATGTAGPLRPTRAHRDTTKDHPVRGGRGERSAGEGRLGGASLLPGATSAEAPRVGD